jgi:hypothetical protein
LQRAVRGLLQAVIGAAASLQRLCRVLVKHVVFSLDWMQLQIPWQAEFHFNAI